METNPNEANEIKEDGDPVPLMQARLSGDLFHDLFVPRYSSLATAEPKRIVVIGVWLLMVPSAILGMLVLCTPSPDQSLAMRTASFCVMAVISTAELCIVWKVTKRRSARRNIENEATE